MKNLLSILFILFNFIAFAQDSIPKKTAPENPAKPKAPLFNISHPYIGYGFVYGNYESTNGEVIAGKSTTFSTGLRNNFPLGKYYAMGFGIEIFHSSFHLKQDSLKTFPNSILHNKEKFITNDLKLTYYNRFILSNKKENQGTFIDLGGYVSWIYTAKLVSYDIHDSTNNYGASQTRITNRKLNFTVPYNYGVFVRLGFNRLAFVAIYRMSDLFKSDTFEEMPNMSFGLQFGFH